MPLYDCMLLLKPNVSKDRLKDLVARVGKHVYTRKGVLTDIKSFGAVQLGYGIRKRDDRFFEGQFMQMTMMVPPGFNQELHYLNKEEHLLRCLVVNHCGIKYGLEFLGGDDRNFDMIRLPISTHEDEGDEDDDSYEGDAEEESEWERE